MTRTPEANKRRAPARKRALASGTRVNCEACRMMHPPPGCPTGTEWENLMVVLPPRLLRLLRSSVPHGQRSALIARLLWKELA